MYGLLNISSLHVTTVDMHTRVNKHTQTTHHITTHPHPYPHTHTHTHTHPHTYTQMHPHIIAQTYTPPPWPPSDPVAYVAPHTPHSDEQEGVPHETEQTPEVGKRKKIRKFVNS